MTKQLFISSLYRNDTLFILAETRKEAIEKLKEFHHIDPDSKYQMTREEKQEMNEILKDMHQGGGGISEIATLLAEVNNDIIVIPNGVTFHPIWEKFFRGKFFYDDDIERMKSQKEILDKAEKYERLKEKLVRLGERISEGEVDFVI